MRYFLILAILQIGLLGCSMAEDEMNEFENANKKPPILEGTTKYYHTFSENFAISGEGRYFLLLPPSMATNKILFVDALTKTANFFQVSDTNIKLTHPAFSPEGDRFAMVATPAPFFGVGQLYLMRFSGDVELRLGSLGDSYKHPIFSADGKLLYYFKNISQLSSTIKKEWLSSRDSLAWAVFEYDIENKIEKRVSRSVWGNPAGIFMTKDPSILYIYASDLLEQRAGRSGNTYWWPNAEYASTHMDYKAFTPFMLSLKDADIDFPSPGYELPFLSNGSYRLAGMAKTGVSLIQYYGDDLGGNRHLLILVQPNNSYEIVDEKTDFFWRSPKLSLDGCVIAVAKYIRGERRVTKADQWYTIINICDASRFELALEDITIEKSVPLIWEDPNG